MIHLLAAAAAETAETEGFSFSLEPLWHDQGLPLAIMGMVVVFCALITVVIFISNLPRLMALIEGKPAPAKPAKPAAPAEDPDEVIAVIAAAVEAALGPGARVIHTQQLTPRELSWAQQGRFEHQTSHKPR